MRNELTGSESQIEASQVLSEYGTLPAAAFYRELRELSTNDGVIDIAFMLGRDLYSSIYEAPGLRSEPSVGQAVAGLRLPYGVAKRPIRKSWSGISVAPVAISSAIVSPTPGPIWKPCPLKPKAWNRPGVVAEGPMTGSISAR